MELSLNIHIYELGGGGVDCCNICHSLKALGNGPLLVMYFAYKFGEHILYWYARKLVYE